MREVLDDMRAGAEDDDAAAAQAATGIMALLQGASSEQGAAGSAAAAVAAAGRCVMHLACPARAAAAGPFQRGSALKKSTPCTHTSPLPGPQSWRRSSPR